MDNKGIARAFNELAKLMELYEENPFKIRSYQNAYRHLRKLEKPLSEMSSEEISALKGVGKAISGKIEELLQKGTMSTLERYRERTPEGIQEMLQIKGFGPKKIRTVWQELDIESVGELLYACHENRLVELKGFGAKTQEKLQSSLRYYLNSKGFFHYATLEKPALQFIADWQATYPEHPIEMTGEMRRALNVLARIELLAVPPQKRDAAIWKRLEVDTETDRLLSGTLDAQWPIRIYWSQPAAFGSHQLLLTGSESFLEALAPQAEKTFSTEKAAFQNMDQKWIPPVLREDEQWIGQEIPALIEEKDIKGVIHAHSTYSDGLNTIEQMALACLKAGFEYLCLSDHSQSAFYADGLRPNRVLEQQREIEALNEQLAPFHIFKGIESDILYDGSLDYEEEILQSFDFIIASVHSQLNMDRAKATERLLRAIENPYTTILGHPTGRLLLSRPGYPLDHGQIIDACAEQGVVIELNANPYRLDLDWHWIPLAIEKGVKIAINPDAHSREGIGDIHYGVKSAQKGGLTAANCLNCLSADEIAAFFSERKKRTRL